MRIRTNGSMADGKMILFKKEEKKLCIKPDKEKGLLPEYLFLYFCRPEFDR